MAEPQPPNVREGATGELEQEVKPTSAEDRKAAAALSSLDAREDEAKTTTKEVDVEAVKQAMDRLAGTSLEARPKQPEKKEEVKKVVKVDQADVAVLVEQLELSKPKATELLKAHDGVLVNALKAFVSPVQ